MNNTAVNNNFFFLFHVEMALWEGRKIRKEMKKKEELIKEEDEDGEGASCGGLDLDKKL